MKIDRPIFVTVGHSYSSINRRLKGGSKADNESRQRSEIAGWIGSDVDPKALQRIGNIETTIYTPSLVFQPQSALDDATLTNLHETMTNVRVHTHESKHLFMQNPQLFVESALQWLYEIFPIIHSDRDDL